jgi:hypothetical protein
LERNSLRPSCRPVNDGEEIRETIGLRERTNKIHMYVREPPSRNWYMKNRRFYMGLDFTPLAVETRLRPEVHIL